jgi:hypothetical protein
VGEDKDHKTLCERCAPVVYEIQKVAGLHSH